jgi:hypothetical protein
MATAAVTYAFSNGTVADAVQVSQNFTDLVGFLNTSVCQKDGSIDFTGSVNQPIAPTSGNHLVNKTYADNGPPAMMFTFANLTDLTGSAVTTTVWTPSPGISLANPGRRVSIVAQLTGIFKTTTAFAGAYRGLAAIEVSTDGGATWPTVSKQTAATLVVDGAASGLGWYWPIATQGGILNVTPTAGIQLRVKAYVDQGTAANASFVNGVLSVMVQPT